MLEANAFLCSSLHCRICRSFYFPPFAAPSDFGCQIPRKPTPFIRRNACSIGSTSQFHDDNVIYGNNFQAERRGEFVLRGALPHLPYGKLAVRSQLLLSLCDFSSKISLPRTGRMRDCSTDWRGKSLTPSSSLRVHGDGKVKRYGWGCAVEGYIRYGRGTIEGERLKATEEHFANSERSARQICFSLLSRLPSLFLAVNVTCILRASI